MMNSSIFLQLLGTGFFAYFILLIAGRLWRNCWIAIALLEVTVLSLIQYFYKKKPGKPFNYRIKTNEQ
jgi:uncharacterized membrane protein YjjP (DUF1212 family)